MRGVMSLVAAAGLAGATVLGLASGCSTAPKSAEGREALTTEVQAALASAKAEDLSMKDFLDKAYGYAIFPTVGKGGIGLGGAYGKGELFDHGAMVGYCDMTQATIGFQLGGQSYTEIIAFQTKEAFDNFKNGNLKFSAQATAVAVKAGAGATAKYTSGVSVFTFKEAGLMYEATIGGQGFSYQPM